MILLSDANVLIDLAYVNGLALLPQLGPTEVLDVVLVECEHESQPDIVKNILACGITEVATQPAWEVEARRYRVSELSLQDRLNLYYAQTFGRILLAGDKPLREQCQKEGVEVHGSIWLVEEALKRQLIAVKELCRWLEVWPRIGRRLPATELKRLRRVLQC